MASSSGSVPLKRGLISCLHSHTCRADKAPTGDDAATDDKDLPRAIFKIIVRYYEKAFDRLPCEAMTDLVGLLTGAGGLCLGLLDPVCNIILNTLALFPEETAAATSFSPPAGKRSKRVRDAFPRSKSGVFAWHEVATRSYHSLLGFLLAYFGCLTKEQAVRYLYRANANLLLAIMLVKHDMYAEGEELLDPKSERACAALKCAATRAGHPSPNTLAQLMTIRLQGADFDLLKKLFSADAPLMSKDAEAIHHIVTRPPSVAAIVHNTDGVVVHVGHNRDAMWAESRAISNTEDIRINSTTYRCDGQPIWLMQSGLPEKLQACLDTAAGQAIWLNAPCGDACNYLQTLKMYLLGMIHNFYIKALKLLPTPSGSLMCSFLFAGHCYGSMDPVSNIIVNTIWYYSCGCSLPLSERRKITNYSDILDPLALLRAQVHSLNGLTKLATFVDPQFSVAACALETLCSAKCDIVKMLPSSTERLEKNCFHEAAISAGHFLPLQLGELHHQLRLVPNERNLLLSCITQAQTSQTVLLVDDMAHILEFVFSRSKAPAPVLRQVPRLCVKALRKVSSKRSDYEEQRSWLRSQIEQVLKYYTLEHFRGPKYKLDIIVGVEEMTEGRPPRFDGMCYHVNFTATPDLKLERTLFFAEFWFPSELKPNFCCPLPYPYVARCYYGMDTARKIVYPDCPEYILLDITQSGTDHLREILEMDLVYFSSKRDVELAAVLNDLHSESK